MKRSFRFLSCVLVFVCVSVTFLRPCYSNCPAKVLTKDPKLSAKSEWSSVLISVGKKVGLLLCVGAGALFVLPHIKGWIDGLSQHGLLKPSIINGFLVAPSYGTKPDATSLQSVQAGRLVDPLADLRGSCDSYLNAIDKACSSGCFSQKCVSDVKNKQNVLRDSSKALRDHLSQPKDTVEFWTVAKTKYQKMFGDLHFSWSMILSDVKDSKKSNYNIGDVRFTKSEFMVTLEFELAETPKRMNAMIDIAIESARLK